MIRKLVLLGILLPRLVQAACTATDAYSTVICVDTPTLYYRMNSATSTETNVGSTASCDGTYLNSPTQSQTGIVGAGTNKAVKFTQASSQDLEPSAGCAPATACSFGATQSFTVEIWAKITTDVQGVLIAQASSSHYGWYIIYSAGGHVAFRITTTGGGTYLGSGNSTTALNLGTYYYIAGRLTGGTPKAEIIVNGTSENNSTTPSGSCGDGVQIRVGDFDGLGNYANATLDEPAIFSGTALSDARITAHYTAGITAPPSSGAGLPFSVKRDRIIPNPWTLIPGQPIIPVDAPSFIVARMNKAAIITPSQYQ